MDAVTERRVRVRDEGKAAAVRRWDGAQPEDADLCWTRFRCFDAETGAWLSTDPLGLVGGTRPYSFDGSPTDVVGPFGLSTSGKPHAASEQARAWQGSPDYPGVDDYSDVTLKKGTVRPPAVRGATYVLTTR